MAGELEALWERYRGITIDDLPEVVQLAASQCILDWTGCALWGSREPLALILRAEFETKDDDVTILGTSQRASAPLGAMINGAAGHALDFDDSNLTGRTHYTAATFPAALAVAESRGVSGADLLVAYTVGIEVGSRLRVAVGDDPYALGWHLSSGVHGATGAAGWLLGLDPGQYSNAVGIGAASASGVQANFGSMTKPLHAGMAAEAGVRAAGLAARGFTSSGERAWEQKTTLTGGTVDWERVDALDGHWAVTNTLFKRFVSGAATQMVVDGTRNLGLRAEDVVSAEIRVSEAMATSGYAQFPVPTSGLQAKFSPTGVMAITLLGLDPSNPDSFSDEHVQSRAFQDLIARIAMVVDPDESDYYMKTFVVETQDGSTRTERIRMNRDTGPVEPRTPGLRAKFDTLAGAVIGERAHTLGDLLLALPSVPSVAIVCELLQAD